MLVTVPIFSLNTLNTSQLKNIFKINNFISTVKVDFIQHSLTLYELSGGYVLVTLQDNTNKTHESHASMEMTS